MRLFTLGADFQVELNKEWILLIPEFQVLLKRDKGSPGDYRGEKKLNARKELTFIYFDLDFTSPIREWEAEDRKLEALKYAGVTIDDLDREILAAHEVYNQLLQKGSRSLKTLRAVEKSLDALDTYFEGLDFNERDKKGELVHNPNAYLLNLERLGKAYDSVDKFRRRVAEELMGDGGIRGANTLGRKEGKRKEWNEQSSNNSVPAGIVDAGISFSAIGNQLREEEKKILEGEEEE